MNLKFQATINKDGTITIPAEIGKKIKSEKVNVKIVEAKETKEKKKRLKLDDIKDEDFINYLLDHPIKVDKSVPFLTREEIYSERG